jgi:tetratricopeptide (TPR) repeat protein
MRSRRKKMPSTAPSVKFFATTLWGLVALTIMFQIAAMGPLRSDFWGFHLYSFMPLGIAILAWILLILSAVWWLRPHRTGPTERGNRIERLIQRPIVATVSLAVVCAVLFWIFRSQQTLLGDAYPLTVDLSEGKSFHPRQPLSMALQHYLYQELKGWFEAGGLDAPAVAHRTVAMGSVIAGFFFVLVSVALGYRLVRDASHTRLSAWLIALVLLAQGYAVLFFGYVENYTFYTLCIGLYLLAAILYLDKRLPLAVAAIVIVACLGLHLSTVGLIPSFLFLAAWGLYHRNRRVDAALGVGAAVVGVIILYRVFHFLSPSYDLWFSLKQMAHVARTSQGGGEGLSYMFSATHIRDFFNEHFLIGPLAAFLFVPGFLYAGRKKSLREPVAIFLSLAALVYLAGSWAMTEPLLGYARDWDLFAPAGVCYCTAGLYFVSRHVTSRSDLKRLLSFGLVYSLLQIAPFVWINRSEERSLERFKTLPLGIGRTEVVVGNWYLRKNRKREAEEWLKRALRTNPQNINAHGLLGQMYLDVEEYERARVHFRAAVTGRPDKMEFHVNYVHILLKLGNCEAALPHLRWLAERMPERLSYWHDLGITLNQLECDDSLVMIYEPVLRHIDYVLASDPDNEPVNIMAGIFLVRINRLNEALEKFQRVLGKNPSSDAALFNAAGTLARLGRADDARQLFERFLELYPDHPLSGQARAHLGR